ncbi:MAG TPA: hypothetical protein VK456_17695 [Xanthobacteraceae bacterium]|nr:hypothetical protein [Xanthobacteraceae bacterium]
MDDQFKIVTIFVATGTICAGLATSHTGECRLTREICQVAPEDQVHAHDSEPVPGQVMRQITVSSTASSHGPFHFVNYVVKR